MARIPSYDSPQVDARPLPGVRISDAPARDIAAAGGAMARGLGAFGDLTGQIAAQEQDKANKAAQLEIENQLSELETSTLHAPDTGLLNRQGKDAIGIGEQFAPTWKRRADEIVSKAPGHLRDWAAQRSNARRTDARQIVMRHSTQEGQRYYVAQADSLIANSVNAAGLNYLDPERVEQEAARAMLAADQRNRLQGGDETMGELLRSIAASRVHRTVIDRLIAEDPSAAAARLERVRGQMTAADLTDLESTLRPVLADADAGAWIEAQSRGLPPTAGALPAAGAAASMKEAEAIARGSVGRTIGLESSGRADAKNPDSTAEGVGQFIDGTWFGMLAKHRPELLGGLTPTQLERLPKSDPRRAEVVAHKRDPVLSRQMAEAYAVENARGLFESGLPVTEQTVYMAHHFGLGGARALLRADPDTPVSRILSAKVIADNRYLTDRKTGRVKTVAELIANHQGRAGEPPAATDSSRAPAARTVDGRTDWLEIERRAQGIPNPVLRDRVLARARSAAGIEARAQAEAEKSRSERIISAINEDPLAPLAKRLSPADYAAAAADGKLPSLESYRQNMIEGGQRQDDYARVEELMRMAAVDPGKFMRENIAAEADRFSTPTLSRLLNMQREGAAKAEKMQDWATEGQRMDSLFRLAGVGEEADARGTGAGKKNVGRDRHRGELRIAYAMAAEAYTRETGKKPEGDVADRLVQRVARDYAEKRRSSDQTTRMERNEERLDDKKPLIYESTERFLNAFGEGERDRVRAAYRSRYGQSPPEWWVDSFLSRAKLEAVK